MVSIDNEFGFGQSPFSVDRHYKLNDFIILDLAGISPRQRELLLALQNNDGIQKTISDFEVEVSGSRGAFNQRLISLNQRLKTVPYDLGAEDIRFALQAKRGQNATAVAADSCK